MRMRRIIAGVLVVAAGITLSGCTPGETPAWRLEPDGTVTLATCHRETASALLIEYVDDGYIVGESLSFGGEVTIPTGTPIHAGAEHWLSARRAEPAEWDAARFTLYSKTDPLVEFPTFEQLEPSGGSDVKRDELREDEWAWPSNGIFGSSYKCEPRADATIDSSTPTGTPILDAAAFAEIRTSTATPLGLLDHLISMGSPELLVATQNRIVADLHDQRIAHQPLGEALAALYGPGWEALIEIVPLAAIRLGYAWDPTVVELDDWATGEFPDTAAFTTSSFPFPTETER